jgi:hypothetical protein
MKFWTQCDVRGTVNLVVLYFADIFLTKYTVRPEGVTVGEMTPKK